MLNNDVLRRARYIFDFDDARIIVQPAKGTATEKDDDPAFQKCNDRTLAIFLNGLINALRGKKPGPQPEPESRLTNNMIFMKLKIALNLQAEDVLAVLELANFRMSKHELSAFFRKPGHKHYRECKDQILRNFLAGLQIQFRDGE